MTDTLKKVCTAAGFFSWCCLYFACVSCILTLISNDPADFLTALILVIPFAGTLLLSRSTKNAALYIGYHILLLAVIWGMDQAGLFLQAWRPWVFSGLILAAMIIFFAKRIYSGKTDDDDMPQPDHPAPAPAAGPGHSSQSPDAPEGPARSRRSTYFSVHPAAAVVFFILWLAADALDAPQTAMAMTLCACVFLLTAILTIYLTNIEDYISGNRQIANIPIKAIIRSGNGSITAFLLLGLVLMAVFTHMGLERFLTGLKDLLLAIIRFLFSFLPQGNDAAPVPETEVQASSPSGFPLEGGETSPIMEAISNFLVAFMQIALILGAAALVIYIVYQLWSRFLGSSLKKESSAKDPSGPNDVVEKLKKTPSSKRGPLFFSSLPKNKIRRIYYKKISGRHKQAAIDPSMTPDQLTRAIAPNDPEAARKFTEIYEKARYSKTPDDGDISAYKELSGKI